MGEREEFEKIEPAYAFGDINEPVLLDKGEVRIEVEGKTYRGEGEMRLEFSPRPRIVVTATLEGTIGDFFFNLRANKSKLDFRFKDRQYDAFQTGSHFKPHNPSTIDTKWHVNQPTEKNTSTINCMVFHLFNFSDIVRPGTSCQCVDEQRRTGDQRILHIYLPDNEWEVELQGLPETYDRIKRLQSERGYGLTHVGRFRKKDGSSFSTEKAEDIFLALNYFLSFARGFWCGPVMPVGFEGKNRFWEPGLHRVNSWRYVDSWFSGGETAKPLVELFPGFMEKWNDASWKETLREVIYWYLNANDSWRGLEAGIILVQAACERLAYEYAVRQKKLLDLEGFTRLTAADQLGLLLGLLGIPTKIPDGLEKLNKLAREFNWKTAPRALTEIRNNLVHPIKKNPKKYQGTAYEAWTLGLWYLELAILAICGYQGEYVNRITAKWVGETELVPWAKPQP